MTNNVVAKFAVAFVAVAMMFSAVAPVAKAADVSTMSLDELIALVTQLQSQLGQSSTGSTSGSCESIAAPLTMGAQGASVTALQNRLIAAGQVIPAGATGYFGSQTQSALAAWQAANGVTPAVGYYGPITQAAMDAACVPATEEGEEEEEEEGEASVTLSGEAQLKDITIDSASDDEVEEGAEDAEVAEVTFEFEDGDAEISRLDIAFDNSGVDMWDVLEDVSLWIDGEEVARMNADDEDDYQSDEATLRFSGLDIVAMEDEEVEMVIAVTVQGNLDSTDLSASSGNFSVSVDAIRFFDADGVADTFTSGFELDSDVVFTVVEAGADDELIAKSSTSDPASKTLKVKDNAKSDWYNVFTFDLDTDDSVNDIELNSFAVNVLTTVAGYSTLVDDAELVIDGVTIDDVAITLSTTTIAGDTALLTFDIDGDVAIDAGDRVAAELMLRFKSLSSGNEGATVKGSVTALSTSTVDAEGAADLEDSQLSGAATGKVHTLRTTGIEVSPDAESAVVTTGQNALDDYATYKLTVEVTAFDQDAFIPVSSASTSWSLVDSAGAAISPAPNTASTSVVITSSAEVGGAGNAFFEINEGETETVTITVTFTPSIANTAAGLQLNSLLFDAAGTVTGADDKTWTALPTVDYRTDVVTIVN